MKALFLIIVVMTFKSQALFGQIKSEDLLKIIEQARLKFELPSVAVTLLNSNEIYLSEIQGVRIHGKNNVWVP